MATDAVKGVYDLINSEKKKEGSSIQPKEFFWDQFLKYIASAILALTVLNVTVEFLRGGGVSCFPPSDNVAITAQDLEGKNLYEFGRGQTSYINNYCARSVPNTEYFPIYILVHGLLLIVPHYIWSALHNGDFDSFFSIVDKLDRLRDSKTGEYDNSNFDRVTKLELEYSGRKIYYTYNLKLFLQFVIIIISVIFSALFFQNFSFIFFCPGTKLDEFTCPEEYTNIGVPCGWPLNTTVPCVYTSLRILNLVRYADFFLLVIAAGLVVYGFIWCFVRHTEQLGYLELAKFSFQSCLKPENFVFPSILSWPTYPCFTSKKEKSAYFIDLFWPFTHYPCLHVKQIFSPRILHDLDFLLLMLFRADSSHGQVFKDIQTTKELKAIVGRDHQLLHLYINIQQDINQFKPSNDINCSKEIEKQHEATGCLSCLRKLFRSGNGNSVLHEDNSGPSESSSSTLPQSGSQSGSGNSTLHEDNSGPSEGSSSTLPSNSTQQPPEGPGGDQQQVTVTDEVKQSALHKVFLQSGYHTDPEFLLYEHFRPHLGRIDYKEEYMKGIRDVLFWLAAKSVPKLKNKRPRNFVAMDISFGSIGYSLILARPFVKVVSISFQPHYQNATKEPVIKKMFPTNYVLFKFPSTLYSQSSECVLGAQKEVLNLMKHLPEGVQYKSNTIDFIVIAPITEESKLVSVNLLLNVLSNENWFTEGAILLAIRPLKIGNKKVHHRFYKYEPSESMFKHLSESNFPDEDKRFIDGFQGVRVQCGDTPCVFEMEIYEYQGSTSADSESEIIGIDSSRLQELLDSANPTHQSEPETSSQSGPSLTPSQGLSSTSCDKNGHANSTT